MDLRFPSVDREVLSVDHALQVVNRFHWNLTVQDDCDSYQLLAGEVLLAEFSSEEEMGVFLTGMAVALDVLPEEIRLEIDRYVGA